MCCRYYFDQETLRGIEDVADQMEPECRDSKYQGDIHPSDEAVILLGEASKESSKSEKYQPEEDRKILLARPMRWGFPGFDGRQLLINARAESAMDKVTFRESVHNRRCIIPASHFYEWHKTRTKVTFSWDDSPVLYMAGCYSYFPEKEEFRFTILTTAANASMRPVHDRMPLILPKNQVKDWILRDACTEEILAQSSPILRSFREYEQLSIFDVL